MYVVFTVPKFSPVSVAYNFPTISVLLCVVHISSSPSDKIKLQSPPAVEHCAISFISSTGTQTNSLSSGPRTTSPLVILFWLPTKLTWKPAGIVAVSSFLSLYIPVWSYDLDQLSTGITYNTARNAIEESSFPLQDVYVEA